jgi:DNA-binding GntR family transcriptional regulator
MDALTTLPRINAQSISNRVYEIMREKILNGELPPGMRLDLQSIGKQLGISRTPLKEALYQLEIDGLVEINPRSGTYVSDLSPDNVAECCEVRRVLEVYAVEVAVQRASDEDIKTLRTLVQELAELAAVKDPDAVYARHLRLDHEFHKQIVALARNSRLSRAHAHENIQEQIKRIKRIRYSQSGRDLDVIQQEHERIMAAFQARDAKAAKAAMDAHLRRAAKTLLADMGVES